VDFVARLPPGVPQALLGFLDIKSVVFSARVSKAYLRAANDERLW
jgi:hypothetical protein